MTALQLLVSGLLLGGAYALIAMGLTLIFGVMRLINFSQGEFVTLGMYGAVGVTTAWGASPYLSLVVVIPAAILVGLLLERTIFRRIGSAPHAMQMLVTFGLSIALQNAMLLLFGGDYRSVGKSIAEDTIRIGEISIGVGQLVAFAGCLVAGAGILAFLKYTQTGKALRAIQQNRYAIRLMGVNVGRLFSLTFAFGICLAAIAGVLLAPNYFISPTVGGGLVYTGFIVVVLGGMGSVPGALLGGALIGLTESFSGFFLPGGLKDSISLLVFLVVLLAWPAGLLGQRGSEEVGFK